MLGVGLRGAKVGWAVSVTPGALHASVPAVSELECLQVTGRHCGDPEGSVVSFEVFTRSTFKLYFNGTV